MKMHIAGLVLVSAVGFVFADGDRLTIAPVEEPDAVSLPITVDQIWYRAGGNRERGQLMVTEEGMEITMRKRTVNIPMDRIHVLSFGKMKGDVDTDWVVMAVGVSPPLDLVGVRDGRKLGFGTRTDELYAKLSSAVRRIGAAQYRVAPGFKLYEDPSAECAFSVPESWNVYVQSMVFVEGRASWGTTVLSEEAIRRPRTSPESKSRTVMDPEALERALDGRAPAFIIERSEAGRGMECDRLSEKARGRVLERAARDRVFGRGYEVLQAPSASAATVGGCDGLHVVGRTRSRDGVEMVLEQFVAASNGTLYSFGLRAPAARVDEFREAFDAAVASVKFAVDLR